MTIEPLEISGYTCETVTITVSGDCEYILVYKKDHRCYLVFRQKNNSTGEAVAYGFTPEGTECSDVPRFCGLTVRGVLGEPIP